MKKIFSMFFALSLLSLCACGAALPEESAAPGESGAPAAQVTAEIIPTETELPNEEPSAMLAAYRAVLETLLNEQTFPDGSKAEYDGYGALTDNLFAVYDVDGDEEDELIISFTTSYMAGMTAYVYGYETDGTGIYSELSAFPALEFYSGGLIKALWSHNQGKAGDSFWPYDVYTYAPGTDTYNFSASIDAWDRDIDTENYPADVDAEKAGMVYYVMEGGWNGNTPPISQADFDAWHTSVFGNAVMLDIPYQNLTPENVAAIG